MKANKYFFLLIPIFFILAKCTTAPVKNITERTAFNDDEGILITKIRTNVKNSFIFIHGKGQKWPWAKFQPVHAPEDLRVIKIKSGEVHFSKFFRGDSFVWGSENYFMIEPGTITYVGDLVIEWVAEEGGVSAYSIVIDREEETVGQARQKYPWIFDKYPYRKHIPSCN